MKIRIIIINIIIMSRAYDGSYTTRFVAPQIFFCFLVSCIDIFFFVIRIYKTRLPVNAVLSAKQGLFFLTILSVVELVINI